jgi:hypothetical protein
VYGKSPEHPIRCRQCNDKLIAAALEAQQWIASLAMTTTITPGPINDPPTVTTTIVTIPVNDPPLLSVLTPVQWVTPEAAAVIASDELRRIAKRNPPPAAWQQDDTSDPTT